MNAKTFAFLHLLLFLDFIFQCCYNPFCQFIGSLAQLVEQRTLVLKNGSVHWKQ